MSRLGRVAIGIVALVGGLASPAAQEAPPTHSEAAFNEGLRGMVRQAQERMANANQTPALRGSGPYPALMEVDLALPDATIYRPADLRALGSRKLGLVIWGNGGCTNDGASAKAHLAQLASHGYLVIAPGRPLTGPFTTPGAVKPLPMTIKIGDLRDALDWGLAENGREGSPYFGLIDIGAVAVAGHSCGGMLAMLLADDPRIRTTVIHNIGVMSVLPDNPPLVMHEQRLQGLRSPVLFLLGGKTDIGYDIGQRGFDLISNVPVFLGSLPVGHGGTFDEPHGGDAARVAVDWLEWRLRGNRRAAATFVGARCGLCVDPKWSVRKKQIP